MGHQKYFTVGRYEVGEVLRLVENPSFEQAKKYVDFKGFKVKVSSLRLRTFRDWGTDCVWCGFKGTYFLLERDKAQEKQDAAYHFNLYGDYQSKPVLFTHDHIVPKSAGGKDVSGNTRTMCKICNQIKGSGVESKLTAVLVAKFPDWVHECKCVKEILNRCKFDEKLNAFLIEKSSHCPKEMDIRDWLYSVCVCCNCGTSLVESKDVPKNVRELWESITGYSSMTGDMMGEGNSGEFSDAKEAERIGYQLQYYDGELRHWFEKLTGYLPVKVKVDQWNPTWKLVKTKKQG